MNNDDPQANRGPEIVLLMIILLAVTWTSVILRFYTRIWITKAFAADDWLIIAALVSKLSQLRRLVYFQDDKILTIVIG